MLTDYTNMTPERAIGVVDEAIVEGEALVAAVISEEGDRTYENTMAPLDRCVIALTDAYGVGGHMARVHPDEAVRAAGSEAEEKQQKWLADLAFNRDLYLAVKAYSETADASALDGERRRNLDFWLRDFRRAGQELGEKEREHLQQQRAELIEKQVAYEHNLDEWEDWIEVTRDELDGLPDTYIDRLAPGEAEATYRVTVDYPEYFPFMFEAKNRELRRQLQFKFMNQAAAENIPLLNQAVAVRWEMAKSLGYPTFADYAMELKMADPEAVDGFYGSIIPGLTKKATEELAALQALMDEELEGEQIMPWDWMYYDTLQRKRDYGVDDSEVAEYFPLEAVVAGMFDICGEMLGVDFVEVDDPKAWHPDVSLYEIRERTSGESIGHYYADLHPRPGKYGHAACWRLRAGFRDGDSYRRPVATVAANFTNPTEDSPSLLKHDEALTLFHEFGHVIHNTLTEVETPRFSGSQTERDFVEAPSQIMENWMWEPEVLRSFARHYETGEPIPEELVHKMVAARDQNLALKTLRQVFLGHYDLALHGGEAPMDADEAYYAVAGVALVPPHPGAHFGANFEHMMSNGYVAGYYGYLWSKVYGDDMFSVFEEEGILKPEVGMRYRAAILAKGGTADGLDLLRGFLGREPSSEAFLRRIGLADS
ncbi:MAG: M3 family metallopeptidase [Acidimicrobiia bacterium]